MIRIEVRKILQEIKIKEDELIDKREEESIIDEEKSLTNDEERQESSH